MPDSNLRVDRVTADRWPELETLFGPSGAYGNCWCMFFRVTADEFDEGIKERGKKNRASMERLVKGNETPGLIAYRDQEPVGWVSVAPKNEFGRYVRSSVAKSAAPQEDVWSIVCFFIPKQHRGGGVGHALMRAAVDHARKEGATAVEGYAIDPSAKGDIDANEAYVGPQSMFEAAGFHEIARNRPARPLMRLELDGRTK